MRVLIALLAIVSQGAFAQYQGTLPPNAEAGFYATQDSEKFSSQTLYVGAAIANGLGARLGYSNYSGPDFTATSTNSNSTFAQLTYVNVGENHDFHGAVGTRINGQSENTKAEAELHLVMTDSLTFGLNAATDIVESANAIRNDVTYVSVGADTDLLLDENLNLNLAYTTVMFSDGNDRQAFKTKLTWTFYPEQGLSAYVRTKNQWDNSPGSINYFSPEKVEQVAMGLQIRKPHEGLVYTAGFDFGNERITTLGGDVNTNPIYTWNLGVQTSPGKKFGNTFGVSLISSNASITAAGGSNYSWYGLYSWVKVPLQ